MLDKLDTIGSLSELFSVSCERGQLGDIWSLDTCPAVFFSTRQTSRPTGYVAQTMFHFGGLATRVLLDSGATCGIIPEEVLCILLAYLLTAFAGEKRAGLC